MAEYRIVAKIDPQTGEGSAKVKQDLRGIQTEAKAVDTALNNTGRTAATAGKGFDQAAGSIERMSAAQFKAAGGLDGLNKTAAQGAASQAQLEAALRRVLAATNDESAAQMRMNALLRDAKTLLDAGKISTEQYANVQKLAAGQTDAVGHTAGTTRIAQMELSHVMTASADAYAAGTPPLRILQFEMGRVAQAASFLGGGEGGGVLGTVGRFMAGPWGIAVLLGVSVLSQLIPKLLATNDKVGEATDKLKEDAAQADITRAAHERWIGTLDALIERQGRLADAMKKRLQVQGLTDQSDLQQAQRDAAEFEKQIRDQQGRIANLQKQLTAANAPIALTGGRGDEAALGQQALRVAELRTAIKTAQSDLDRLQGAAGNAQTRIIAGQILVGEQQGKALVDLTVQASAWQDKYTDALRGILQKNDQLRAQTPQIEAGFAAVSAAVDKAASAGLGFQSTMTRAKELGLQLQSGQIGVAGYRSEMAKLADTLTKAAEAAEKAKRTTSDGVATFVSAKQAIGIAGRELQSAGLHVSENEQFGGVTPGVHSGAGHGDGRAIDVNQGTGIVEANVPDIRARFDAMAQRYAARGYIVLWNRKRYSPNGGPITAIPAGQDQHLDHMHIEAPTAIVGKPTQSSTEAQAQREEKQGETAEQKAARTAREEGDFVGAIVDQQSLRGLANGPESLEARMTKIVGDYARRFDGAVITDADKKKIRDALIGGDEREVQDHFFNTYIKPVERLKALQGTSGIDRTVLNAQLEESVRQFGPLTEGFNLLTDAENKTIEANVRRGDQLSREAQLLEQIRGPMDAYRQMVEALNALLAKGEISQTAYNARLAEMNNQATQSALAGLKGTAANGVNYEDAAAKSDETSRYAQQLAAIQDFEDKKLNIGVSYDKLREDAAAQHIENLNKIDQARRDVALSAAESIATDTTAALKSMFGEQSRIYKAAFAVEKAIAIARSIMAIQTGIAQAAALPFPANLPAIASVIAATASIISNIEAVALNFKDGGRVYGPGGPRSDSIPANLSRDEFVVNADAARRNGPLLEAINSGRDVSQIRGAHAAETARIVSMQAPPVVVPPPEVHLHNVNVSDAKAALAALATAEGKRVIVNMIESDPNTFKRLLGSS